MAVKKVFFLFSCFTGLFFSLSLFAESPKTPSDFHSRIAQAYQEFFKDQKSGAEFFERLIEDNPDEYLIYDGYAQALIHRSDFETAKKILQRALERVPAKSPELLENIQSRMAVLEEIKSFQATLRGAMPWKQAKLFGTAHFAFRTNFPEAYAMKIAEKLERYLAKEKEILEDIFKMRVEDFPYTLVYLTGRPEDYQDLLAERKAKGDAIPSVPVAGYFSSFDNSFIIYFDGISDERTLAHEMAHFLIHNGFIAHPSPVFDEGLAEYIAIQVVKESIRWDLLWRLKTMDWTYNQGGYQSVDEIFESGKRYFSKGHPREGNAFYFGAWTLVHYFLKGNGPFFKSFFQQWLKYEKENALNTFESTEIFFKDNLTAEQKNKLDDGWIRHFLHLTYEKI